MKRVSTLRLRAGIALVSAFLFAPFIANVVAGDALSWFQSAHAPFPRFSDLVLLGLLNLLVPFAALSLLRRLLKGTRKQAALTSVAFATVSTIGWLAILYFFGKLADVSRLFVFVHIAALVVMLLAARAIMHQPMSGKLPSIIVAACVVYFGVGGAWPEFQQHNGSYLAGIVAQVEPIFSEHIAWAQSLFAVNGDRPAPDLPRPLVAAGSLVFAGILGRLIQRRYFPVPHSFFSHFREVVIWVAATHFIWLGVLFAVGSLSDVPRWLPIATAAVLVIISAGRYLVALAFAISKPRNILDAVLDLSARSEDPNALAQIVPPSGMIPNTNGRVAWIISMTGVSGEPRVLRQAEALTASGWRVVVCGFDGRSERPGNWHFVRMPSQTPFSGTDQNVARFLHGVAINIVRATKGNPAFSWAAHWAHSTNLLWYYIRKELTRVAREHPELKADLVIAHDYHTSDIGYEVARIFEAKFSVDVHEYAREQYSNDPEWLKNEQPVIVAVQDYYLRRADLITVVCAGISELLSKETRLKREPVTIRNVPFKQPQRFRPTSSPIRVLYHGDLSRHRYIHDIIRSMANWRSDINLVLRGSGDTAYIADLKRSISSMGLENRVSFEPPVPFDQIIPAANSADIGLFSYEAYSPQIRLALPNKLFEYIMAGLAVCITKLDEAGRVVQQYGVGKLIPEHSPACIAETINSFTVAEIDAFKQASLKASEELNWDAEKQKLLSAYESLYPAE